MGQDAYWPAIFRVWSLLWTLKVLHVFASLEPCTVLQSMSLCKASWLLEIVLCRHGACRADKAVCNLDSYWQKQEPEGSSVPAAPSHA